MPTYITPGGAGGGGSTVPAHNHDTRYYTEAEVDQRIATAIAAVSGYSKSEVDALLAGKSATSHNHDSRYYTESEADARFAPIESSGLVVAGELEYNEEPPGGAAVGSWWLRALEPGGGGGGGTPDVIAFRAATAAADGTTATVNASAVIPAGVQAGDLLIAAWATEAGHVAYTGPVGWTLVQTITGGTGVCRVYKKIATSGDAGSTITATPTYNSGVTATRQCLVVAGYDNAADVEGSAAMAAPGSTATVTTPALSTIADLAVPVVITWTRGGSGAATWTPAAGYTERDEYAVTGSGGMTCAISDKLPGVAAGTAVGGVAFTAASAQTAIGCVLLSLAPTVS